jgi:hypothetical protein
MNDNYGLGIQLIKRIGDINTVYNFLEILEDMKLLNEEGIELKSDFFKEWIER